MWQNSNKYILNVAVIFLRYKPSLKILEIESWSTPTVLKTLRYLPQRMFMPSLNNAQIESQFEFLFVSQRPGTPDSGLYYTLFDSNQAFQVANNGSD